MRELEFLPAWYPQTRRRKRLVVLQAWMTFVLVVGLGLYLFLAERNLRAARASLTTIGGELTQTEKELRKLDELLALQKQWQQQFEVHSKVGEHIEGSRMLSTLDEAMPTEMSLLDISFQTEEHVRAVNTLAAAKAQQNKEQQIDRRLRVEMLGVVPTDVDLANFLAKLTAVPFFEQVTLLYAKDRSDKGHLMREFKVTFSMTLNPSGT